LAFLVSAAVAFRAGLGVDSGGFPQGTNALNTGLTFWFQANHSSLTTWMYPFTDWGQPFPGFTGPSLQMVFAALGPTVGVRTEECVAWVGAGLALYTVSRKLGATAEASLVAGLYYQFAAETAQYFEGHVPAMLSVALGPLFLLAVYKLFRTPTLGWGISAAILLYLLASAGDLGVLYFFLVFAVLLGVYCGLTALFTRQHRLRDLLPFGAGFGLVALLLTSWWYPYLRGARPQYTTLITTTSVPFQFTDGADIPTVVTGTVKEKSFLALTYGQHTYAVGGPGAMPLFFLVPVLVVVTLYLWGTRARWATLGGALLAMIWATGPSYPIASSFNGWVYSNVPFFNSIPAVFRWELIAIVGYAVLLALGLSDWQRRAPVRRRLPSFDAWLGPEIGSGSPTVPASRSGLRVGRLARRTILPVLGVLVVAFTLVQNGAVLYEPPGIFQYGEGYIAALPWLAAEPHYGEVLALPFGGIYENTPNTGLTESSLLMIPYYTGADTVIFEAGSPYSLALDQFIGDGLTYDYSRNMSRFLAGSNVQFVVTTDYPSWNWVHSSVYLPSQSYASISSQLGLQPVDRAGYQTVYGVANFTGNVSFHPDYAVYYGPPALLYGLLDDPAYPGPNVEPLVDGRTAPAPEPLVAHASRVEVDASVLDAVPSGVLSTAESKSIPVEIVSRGADLASPTPGAPAAPGVGSQLPGAVWMGPADPGLQTSINWSRLLDAGFTTSQLALSGACPLGGNVSVGIGGYVQTVSFAPNRPADEMAANLSTPGFAAAGASGGPTPYKGNVTLIGTNNSSRLQWQFEPNASYYQYLNLSLTNLSGYTAVAVDYTGTTAASVLRLSYGGDSSLTAGYETSVPIGGNTTRVYYYLPTSNLSGTSVGNHMADLGSVEVGLPRTGAGHSWNISRIELIDLPTPPVTRAVVGLSALPDFGELTISSPAPCEVVSVTISLGPYAAASAASWTRSLAAEPDPTSVTVPAMGTGWGLLLFAQTYSPLWSLVAPTVGNALHVVANIGLNAWVFNTTGGGSWHITYQGDTFEAQSVVIEGGAGATVLVGAAAIWWYRRRGAS
jgi:hypothetical protein